MLSAKLPTKLLNKRIVESTTESLVVPLSYWGTFGTEQSTRLRHCSVMWIFWYHATFGGCHDDTLVFLSWSGLQTHLER